MKICWLLLVVLCVTAAAQKDSKPSQAPIYITHVAVIDTENGREAADQTVILSGEEVANIRDSRTTPVPVNARVVDGNGKYLIPGLWERAESRSRSFITPLIPNGIQNGRSKSAVNIVRKPRGTANRKSFTKPAEANCYLRKFSTATQTRSSFAIPTSRFLPTGSE